MRTRTMVALGAAGALASVFLVVAIVAVVTETAEPTTIVRPPQAAAPTPVLPPPPTPRPTVTAAPSATGIENWWMRLPWPGSQPRTEGVACGLIASLQDYDQAGTNADLDRTFGREGRSVIIWRCATEVDW